MKEVRSDRMFKIALSIVALVITTVPIVQAKISSDRFPSSGYSFRNVPASHGLSQSSVYCMLQDHKGFIWIGTKGGLNRYDGYEFVTYKYDQTNPNSLSNNEVICLENDNNKYLWIGTRSGGINRLEFATGDITRFNDLTYDDLVPALLLDSLDNLWAGTSEGLLLFPPDEDGERNMARNLSETASYYNSQGRLFDPERKHIAIKSIVEINKGTLLVGAEEGLFFYDVDNNSFTSVSSRTFGMSVFTDIIYQEERNKIWTASYEGIMILTPDPDGVWRPAHIFDTGASEGSRLPVDWVEDLVADEKGNVWAGTRGGGLLQIKGNKIVTNYRYNHDVKTSVPDNLINSLMIDRTGILWIGTESRGLGYSDLHAKGFRVLGSGDSGNSLSGDLVSAITGNSDRIWAGTAAGGIDIFEPSGDEVKKMNHIPYIKVEGEQSIREVMALLCDDDDDLWIGSAANSLTVYNEETGFKNYVVDGFVFSLFQDTYQNIWFGTWGQGVGYLDKETGRIDKYHGNSAASLNLSSDKVLSIFQDSRDLLWVGTKGGGVNVSPIQEVIARSGEFRDFRNEPGDASSLSYNDVYDIFEDQNGNIWLATGSGLNKVMAGEQENLINAVRSDELSFVSYSEDDGLAGDLVVLIEEDEEGNLWLGTNKGISKFDPVSEQFVNFGPNDGLPSGELHMNASFRNESTGMMYFGGVDGIAVFHPDSLMSNPFSPKVQITRLMLHNRAVQPGQKVNNREILENNITYTDHLTFSYNNNEISFEFSALHFSNPEKIKYAYRLRGFNEEWQETGSTNRRATYTNLNEGDYVFEVRATNNDGSWDSEKASISFTVKPPLWRTPWAYIFYFVVVAFLLFIFRKYSLIGVKQKNRLIIESIEHKKDRELTEAKMRFFTNISHEIRTPLTLIHAPLQELMKRKDVSSDVHKSLAVMSRNVRRLLNMVNQLLEFRKMDRGHLKPVPSQLNLKELCHDTVTAFQSLAEQKKIRIEVDAEEDIFVHADEKMVTTAIYNLLSNAFKFSPSGGLVSIIVEMNTAGQLAIIKVCDSGPGIPESEKTRVFQRFTQVDSKERDHLAGSGIGLSIVKEFIELNNGEVSVYNLDMGGCCFEIKIPLNGLVTGASASESGRELGSGASPVEDCVAGVPQETEKGEFADRDKNEAIEPGVEDNAGAHLSMCIIEDDVELANWLANVFGNDFRTHVFNDGDKAYAELSSAMPDIVICDVMLPGMSGIELCRKTKEHVETSHIPFVMLTARSGEDNVLEGLDIGADSYMTKPFNIDILKAQVRTLIRSREAFRKKFSSGLSLEPSEETITPVDEKFLNRLMEIIDERIGDSGFDVSVLVDEMHMSHSIILKKVKALTGLSLVEFIRSMRIKKAAQIFKQDRLSVSEVSFMVGFSDPKYFSKCFSKQIGQKPTDFIKMHHGS
ncbi:MAG: hybrid sensor histidine kinase/response regulator transcription factor [Marinilabiliaceae bacterium]